MDLLGLHHVTAITGQLSNNIAFYTQTLGLRLVKKTVNQDDISAYHLFYGDELGRPGSEITFFDWPRSGRSMPGVGMITTIALRVRDRRAIDWWADRLDRAGIARDPILDWNDRPSIAFTDPEGQPLMLVADAEAVETAPWPGSPVPVEMQIQGLHSVTIIVDSLVPTAEVLTEVLGFRRGRSYPFSKSDSRQVAVFESAEGGAGTELHVEERPELGRGRVGVAGVHHVAFRVPDPEEQLRWREHLIRAGLGVTPVIDRYYFKSIYFREPGGILFEIATDGPGFTADEGVTELGHRLALPPELEPKRAEIERRLRPIESTKRAPS